MTATTKTRPVAANVMTVLARVAKAMGKETRKTLEETEGAHKAYVKASKEHQQDMRHVWVNEFMASALNIRNDEADLLRQAPREGAKDSKTVKVDDVEHVLAPRTHAQQQAYDRARKMFAFHISREDSRIGAGKGKKVRRDADVQNAITALCNKVFADGLTKAAVDAVIAQAQLLRASLK